MLVPGRVHMAHVDECIRVLATWCQEHAFGYFARACPNYGFQQSFTHGSSSSVAQPSYQVPQQYPTQFVSQQSRGRARAAAAKQPDQLPPELEIPAAFATGMAGINQGLAALNQAMPLVQQML